MDLTVVPDTLCCALVTVALFFLIGFLFYIGQKENF